MQRQAVKCGEGYTDLMDVPPNPNGPSNSSDFMQGLLQACQKAGIVDVPGFHETHFAAGSPDGFVVLRNDSRRVCVQNSSYGGQNYSDNRQKFLCAAGAKVAPGNELYYACSPETLNPPSFTVSPSGDNMACSAGFNPEKRSGTTYACHSKDDEYQDYAENDPRKVCGQDNDVIAFTFVSDGALLGYCCGRRWE